MLGLKKVARSQCVVPVDKVNQRMVVEVWRRKGPTVVTSETDCSSRRQDRWIRIGWLAEVMLYDEHQAGWASAMNQP